MSNKPENNNKDNQSRMESFPKQNTIPSKWDMSALMDVYNHMPPTAPSSGKGSPGKSKPSTFNSSNS
jgi:hypothetical protein